MPPVSYAIPAGSAAAAVLVALALCLLCHRKMKRRTEEVNIDDFQQRIEDMRYCYHHHTVFHRTPSTHSHSHPDTYNNQYHMEQPSPPSESEIEHVCGDDASSPETP